MNYINDVKAVKWKEKLLEDEIVKISNNRVLITAGDSWTNNNYLKQVQDHWSYKLGIKGHYDYVFNLGTMGGSNEKIYETVIDFLSDYSSEPNINFISSVFDIHLIDVVVMWSSPIRDESPLTKLYQPFSSATIPDINSNKFNAQLYKKYFGDWFRYEYHSYRTQLLTLFLQEFFDYNKISHKFLMGFSPIINKEFENTQWDLRQHINKNNFYGLYGFPKTVQDYLIQKGNSQFKDELDIVEMFHLNENENSTNRFVDYFKKTFRDIGLFKNRMKIFEEQNGNGEFMADGHPSSQGCTSISELIYKLLN